MLWLINFANFLTRITIWFVVKLLGLFIFYPISFIACFRKVKRCPPIDDDVLYYRASEIADKIRKKKISCVKVLESYIERVRDVNPIVNAVVEDRFGAALIDARRIDVLVASGTYSVEELRKQWPLLGVPITVKSSLAVTGCSNASGRWSHKDFKATSDAEIVRLVKEAGAIPILVSNTPELCYNWETYNTVTGRTKNPYDTRRTPGGSSGGEAALLSSAASVLGLGSDVGGSLRIPAAFCGVWGHKPTAGAVSYQGHYPTSDSQSDEWRDVFTVGPMARYASDLPLILQVIAKPEAREILSLEKPVDIKSIKIHYMLNDGGSLSCHNVHSDIKNAIKACLSHFETTHSSITQKEQFKSFKCSAGISFIPLLSVNGVEDVFDGNKKRSAILEAFSILFGCSKMTIGPIGYLLVKRLLDGVLTRKHLKSLQAECDALKKEVEDTLGDNGVLLYPSFPNVAHYHNQIFANIFDASYLSIFNGLGLPVTNCPVGMNKNGLPIGIQVIAKSNCDRLTLAVAQELERVFGGWKPPIFHKTVSLIDKY